MANYDYEYGKIFGVVEEINGTHRRPNPEIIQKPIEFVDSLISDGHFDNILIVTPSKHFNFFPSRKMAEEYLNLAENHYDETILTSINS